MGKEIGNKRLHRTRKFHEWQADFSAAYTVFLYKTAVRQLTKKCLVLWQSRYVEQPANGSHPQHDKSSPNLYTIPLGTVRILFSYVRQGLHSSLLRLGFITRFLYVFLIPPIVLQNLPSTFLDLITLIFREMQKLWSFLLRSFLQPHVTSCVFHVQIYYWQLIFLPAERNQRLIGTYILMEWGRRITATFMVCLRQAVCDNSFTTKFQAKFYKHFTTQKHQLEQNPTQEKY